MSDNTERRNLAVLFSELRNFTRLSEVLQPAKVLELANEFFELAGRLTLAQGGKILAVHNDSLMSIFDGAEPTLAAAQDIQREFEPIGERWKDEYGLPAAVALGAHLGEAVLGTAGPAGAGQFVAFGDCVSVAERIVHRARAGEIVLSFDLMRALGPKAATLGAQRLPPLEIARRPPIPIYGILLETRLDFT